MKEDRLTSLEKLAAGSGAAWVWMACSPGYTLGPAGVGGKRTWRHARRLFCRLQSATDGPIPFFPSDALSHSADAVLEVCGHQELCILNRHPDASGIGVIKQREGLCRAEAEQAARNPASTQSRQPQ